MTYQELLKKGTAVLLNAEVPDGALDAKYLLMHVTGWNQAGYFSHIDELADQRIQAAYLELIEKRSKRIPLQHLTGEQEFMGLTFSVNENVLIPRQDTELLVEEALVLLKEGDSVLDLCTGSGCIIISLASLSKGITATATDLSALALEIAKKNAAKHQVEVDFLQGDLFRPVQGTYDLITSNPPYIVEDVIPNLMPEVKDHDPYMALSGGEDGLDFYRIIAKEAPEHLNPGGFLLLEIGNDQGEAVKSLLEENGFHQVQIKKDLCKNDRVVMGHL